MKSHGPKTAVLVGVFCSLLGLGAAEAQMKMPTVDADGTVHLPDVPVPYSALASAESKAAFIRMIEEAKRTGPPNPAAPIEQQRQQEDARQIPIRDELVKIYGVDIVPQMIGGVQTDVVAPKGGVAPGNKDRVLINLHGGGFATGARVGGQIESIPLAAIGGFKVVTVDYREGPEHHYPAASEDVATVYRELLKTHRPENIGIYGCSAGGLLTTQSLAWFQAHGLPTPGAVGVFGSGGQISGTGDSNYVAAPLMGWPMPPLPPGLDATKVFPYFMGADPADPLLSPGDHPDILRRFPPTLVISGTRDLGLSASIHLHSRLTALGVDADLHVWEAQTHCGFLTPNIPESREAWDVIARFFDKRLGQRR
jgi:acetyl esterase/lipase